MKGWLKGVLKQDRHDEQHDEHSGASSSSAGSEPHPSAKSSAAAADAAAKPSSHLLSSSSSPGSSGQPSPMLSPSLLSPHVPAISPASTHPAPDAPYTKDFPTLLAHAQRLISAFLSKRHADRGSAAFSSSELLQTLQSLSSHPSFDATRLGTDGTKLVGKLSDVCARATKHEGGLRSPAQLHDALTAAQHDLHDMDAASALRALFCLFTGPPAAAGKGGSGPRMTPPPFSSGHNAATKAHLPCTLMDFLLANASVSINASGQSTHGKKQNAGAAPAAAAAPAPASSLAAASSSTPAAAPPLAKASSSPTSLAASSLLSDCEYHSFTILAILCSHDHTAIEDLLSHHKLEAAFHLATAVGPSPFSSVPITAVFHSNLVKLLKVVSKGQKVVRAVAKAAHETGLTAALVDHLRTASDKKGGKDATAAATAAPSSPSPLSAYHLAYDCFDLLTSLLMDSFPHSPVVLEDFERHDGYAALQSFCLAFDRRMEQRQHTRTVARRLTAVISIGYEKLEVEHDVLPFNLPPSSRTHAAQTSTAWSASSSPSSASPRVQLSTTLSVQPTLPDTHSHTIGQLPSTPSIARIRGHARSASLGGSNASPHALGVSAASSASPASSSSASGGSAGLRSISSSSCVRNLEAVQVVRDVFLQCCSSALRLHLLFCLEWLFTSSTQLQLVSSTNLMSRLLQSLQSFSTPVQHALLQSLHLLVTHNHNDYIPFKELCALNITLTSDLTRLSLQSVLSVVISLDSMLDYDQLRYQHLLREAGVLDVMITNITQWYTQFAVAFEQRYEPYLASPQALWTAAAAQHGSLTPVSPFSPRAATLSSIRHEVRKRREGFNLSSGTPSGSPVSVVRRRLDVEERREGEAEAALPSSAHPSPASAHPNHGFATFAPAVVSSAPEAGGLSASHLVRVVTAGLDVLTVLLRDNSNNQELFSTTAGPAVLLSFTVYPPTATPALHLVEMLLQSHYAKLEAMMPPPMSAQGGREKREEGREKEREAASSSISIDGIMTASAPKTVQALQLLGDCYMLTCLHLLFESLPAVAFELPFYRPPPADPALLLKPSHASLSTHPQLASFFPLPTRTSVVDAPSVLRVGRLLHLIRRALSSSYYGQQSFGRMQGFERVFGLLSGLSVRQLQLSRGEVRETPPVVRQSSASSGGDDSSVALPPPSTSHSACLFLMQEVMLTFILAMNGNERNSHYSFPRPLPSHFHLTDQAPSVGFHTVGYRRLGRALLRTGAVRDSETGVSWSSCADLVCNWLFWLCLEYLPADSELISTPSLPCTLNPQQWERQVAAELREEQEQIQQVMEEQKGSAANSITAAAAALPSSRLPPVHTQHASAAAVLPSPPLPLRVNTEDPSGSTGSCWWEEQEQTIEFSSVQLNKLVIPSPGLALHPMALRLVSRFLPYSSPHLQRRLVTLLTMLSRSNAANVVSLGQADVLAPLIPFFRSVLCNPADVRHQAVLDLVTLLLPFTPSASALHGLFSLFELPGRFPASLYAFLSDMATRSVPMPYALFDGGREAGVRIASIANSKWPASNGYTAAVWMFIENSPQQHQHQQLSINAAGIGKLSDAGRRSPAPPASPAVPPHPPSSTELPSRRLSASLSPDFEPEVKSGPSVLPVRKLSGSLPPPAGHRTSLGATPSSPLLPSSPSPPPSSAASASPPSTSSFAAAASSLQSFHVLRLESDDSRSLLDLLFNPQTQQLTLRTSARSSYVFSGVKLTAGRWHHVCIAHSSSLFQGSWCHLFVNGQRKLESKVAYVNKGGGNSNVSACMGGAVRGVVAAEPAAASGTGSPAASASEAPRHASNKSSVDLLHVPSERPRSNSVSLSVTDKDDTPPPSPPRSASPLPSVSSSSPAAPAARSPLGVRWRFASVLLADDFLPEAVVRSLYELGPRLSGIVHPASRPAVVDTLAAVYQANRALNTALDNLPAIIPKISKRAWSAVEPAEEASVTATARRATGPLLDLDAASRVRIAASPAEAGAKSVTSVVGLDKILFFFHAANGQDVASTHHATSIQPRQVEWRIPNSGLPAVCSDARLSSSCHLVQARSLVSRVKQAGGMCRLLSLVEKCAHTADNAPEHLGLAMRHALLLIAQAVRRQPSNHREMQDINGYRALGHLLKLVNRRQSRQAAIKLAQRRVSLPSPQVSRAPSPVFGASVPDPAAPSGPAPAVSGALLDCVAVEILFSLVGLSDSGCSGEISNVSALNELLLDFHIWRECAVEVQLFLFQGLFNSICMSACKNENIAVLRESRLVGWIVSLASDISLHPDVLNSCVSIIRELMMHSLVDHELHLVADFAVTSIMTDTRAEVQAGGRRSLTVPRAGSLDAGGVTVLSSDDSAAAYLHEQQRTPLGTSRRVVDDSGVNTTSTFTPLDAAASFSSDSAFRVHIGSRASARVKGLFIEMLLDVALKLRGNAKALQLFFKRIDFLWLYSVLHSGEPRASQPNGARATSTHTHRGSVSRASVLHHSKQAGSGSAAPEPQRASGILALKLLMVLLEDSHLFHKFKHSPGFSSLPPLLLPHCHHNAVFSILLCMMMGRQVQDVPTAPLDVNAISTLDAWAQFLTAQPAGGDGPVVVPELVPVVIALLRECIELAKYYQANAAAQAAVPAASSSFSLPRAAATSPNASPTPQNATVVLDLLEPFERSRSAGDVTDALSVAETENGEPAAASGVRVITDLSDVLEISQTSPAQAGSTVASPASVRHLRTLTILEGLSMPSTPSASQDAANAALSPANSRPPSVRSPSRRATFNAHRESGSVAATTQTRRRKGHHRAESVTVYDIFSPSHELLAAAEATEDGEQSPPKSPLSARISGLLHSGESKADDSVQLERSVGVADDANGSPLSRSVASLRPRHRSSLTISTAVPEIGFRSGGSGKEAQLRQPAAEVQMSSTQPVSPAVVITQPEGGGSSNATVAMDASNSQPASDAATSRIPTPVSSLPRTPVSQSPPVTPPEAVHTTTALKALRAINNRETFHQLSHFRTLDGRQAAAAQGQPAPHHSHSSSSSEYSLHYHAHIEHQPDIKAMNGTITFLTRLFNVSDAFRTIACKTPFIRRLIAAVFASATMGVQQTQPHLHAAVAAAQQAALKRSAEESRVSSPIAPASTRLDAAHLSHRHNNVVSDDPTVPAAPAFDPFLYFQHGQQRSSLVQPSVSRQSSEETVSSPSHNSTGDAASPLSSAPRMRKASSLSLPSQLEQPVRGPLANIDTADLFRHSTSVLLFQLLRQIVVQNLLTRTKGTQMLIDCLDQAPHGSSPQQRIRYQTTLLAGLSSRLEERISGLALVSNSKLAYTIDRLGQLWIERLEQGLFLNGGPSTFQFLLHLLRLPECRQVVEEQWQAAAEKDRGGMSRLSATGLRMIRPLYEALNQVVLLMYGGYSSGELTAADLLQMNAAIADNARLVLGEHNSGRAWLACLCYFLFQQMLSPDSDVSAAAIRLWSWLMKNRLEVMMELLKATVTDEVRPAQLQPSQPSSALSESPRSSPTVSLSSLSVSAPSVDALPPSPSSRSVLTPAPITRRRTVDLYDDDGHGGFDHLLQSASSEDAAAEPPWLVEFRVWLRANERKVRDVFAVTLAPHWQSHHAQQRREQMSLGQKQQQHVVQDMERHRQEGSKRMREAAQMELSILSKLQATSNVEIQRLLRREQRSSEIEKQADRLWAECSRRLAVTAMMLSYHDYHMPSTAERLRKMREEVLGKRSWTAMMGPAAAAAAERSWAAAAAGDEDVDDIHGDDCSVHIDEQQEAAAASRAAAVRDRGDSREGSVVGPVFHSLSNSLVVLRQPWRLEPTEGPARMRRRLCDQLPLRADVPLFTHPYKLWEEERRSSISGEDREPSSIVVEVTDSTVRVEDDADNPLEMEAGAESRDEDELQQKADEEAEEEEISAAAAAAPAVSYVAEIGQEGVPPARRPSVNISADGDITTDLPVETDPSSDDEVELTAAAVQQPPRSLSLTINTDSSRSARAFIDGVALGDIVPAAAAPAALSLSTPSPRSSVSSAENSRGRGLSFTATSSDSIPAVAAEPRRRKTKQQREQKGDEQQSPFSPSPSSPLPLSTPETEVAEERKAPVGSEGGNDSSDNSGLPRAAPLLPVASAPIPSVASSERRQPVDIRVTAPPSGSESETAGSDSPAASPLPADAALSASDLQQHRRTHSRPRSLTAEGPVTAALAPPAGYSLQPSLSATHVAGLDRPSEAAPAAHAAAQVERPQTPAVSLPDSRDDDEGVEEARFLEEEKLLLLMEGDDIHYHWNCVRIDGMEEVRGILCLCDKSIFLVDNYEISQQGDIVRLVQPQDGTGAADSISGSNCSSAASSLSAACLDSDCRRWSYGDVSEVAKRRYLLRPAALELFFVDGTNHLLVLNVEQREAVFSQLVDYCPAVRSSRFLKSASGFFGDAGDGLAAMQAMIGPISKQWQTGEISNFDYLIALNSVAGRTYNDLTQYPVFPWVVKDFDSPHLRLHDPASYRDLSKPMGALTEPRASIFRQRYRESQQLEEGSSGYHFGTHYSTAAVVLYFLLRCEPFTQHVIAFQSGRFDRPDRLFHSIKQSFLSASQQNVMDVKELIPEWYSQHEFLVNGNGLKLGVRQDEQRVNDVLLPRWAHGSSRQFIRLHRAALESEYVSAHLHHWIDLIFGFQQQGERAVDALNVFYPLTYAGRVDIDKIADPTSRAATIEQIRSFGQTPIQLFTAPHPPRRCLPRLGTLFRSALLHRFVPVKSEMVSHAVGGLYVTEGDGRVYVTRPGFVIVPTAAPPAANAHFGVSRLLSFKRSRVASAKTKSSVAFVSCGFADQSVRTGLVAPNMGPAGFSKAEAAQYQRVYLNMHDVGGVAVVAVPELDSGLLVTAGTEDCTVCVWKAEPTSTGAFGDFAFQAAMYGHSQPVTCLAVSRAFSLIASGSSDSTVIMWDLNRKQAVRQLRVVPYGAVITALSFDHANGYLLIASRSPDTLSLVDVNGVLLAQYPDIRRMMGEQAADRGAAGSSSSTAQRTAETERAGSALVPPGLSVSNLDSPRHARSGSAQPTPTRSPALAPSHASSASFSATSDFARTALQPARAPAFSLSLRDPISALYVVDASGYHFLNSLMLCITGHSSGKVRLWYVTFDPIEPQPQHSAPSSLAGTLRFDLSGTASSLSPPPADLADGNTEAQQPQLGKDGRDGKGTEEEHKTLDASSAERPLATVLKQQSLPVVSDSALAGPQPVRVSSQPVEMTRPASPRPSTRSPLPAVAEQAEPAEDAAHGQHGSPASAPRSFPSPPHLSADASAADRQHAHQYAGDPHEREAFDCLPSFPLSPRSASSTSSSGSSLASPSCPSRSWHLRPMAEWHRHSSAVISLHVNADCTQVYSGDSHGAILHWALPQADEQRVNSSGVSGPVPRPDALCLCKLPEKAKDRASASRAAVRRFCVCHPRTCRQVVCDACVLDHIRSRHSPTQHRALLAQKHRAAKEQQQHQRHSNQPSSASSPLPSPVASSVSYQ